MSIAAIILAAGASKRLGRPKQTVVLEGEMLVERAVRVATEAGLAPVIAVLIDAGLIDSLQAQGATVLLNRRTYEGISSSIAVGIRWAKGMRVDGVVLMTCDQVAVTPQHLQALFASPDVVTGSRYAERTGIPAYFPAESFDALMALEGDTGARDLLRDARSIPDESLALDVDTDADLEEARRFLRAK
ncbi:MAG TPA: NTP transferase domain-containing protein [Acidobacteriaceae bacterium]|jgi:CTP:molybdopterin cytidylyltransferase MocA